MILQALHDYYQRKSLDPDPARRLPAFGLEEKEIAFVLELTRDGQLAGIKDTRTGVGKQKSATRFLVTKGAKRSSGVAANLLWDNAEYVLGAPDGKKLETAHRNGKSEEYERRLVEMHAAFRARISALPPSALQDEGVAAVLAFLDHEPLASVATDSAWPEIAATNPTLTFRLSTDIDLVAQRPAVSTASADPADAEIDDSTSRPCLVTGDIGPTAQLHTAIKGVWGAQTSGANIVSFNLDAFRSFGKEQGANAPVGSAAAFAYTTALNHLLEKGSRQRMQVGDASTVFWSQREDDADMEDWFAEAFGQHDDPDARTDRIRALFDAIQTGRFDGARGEGRFFVLGLAPNAARIAVRFWHTASLADIAVNIRRWFDDLRIVRGPNDPEYPSLFRLLTAIALQNKADNIPPRLGGDIMRAILTGSPFPATWLNAAVQRSRAEQKVTWLRAAAIRACLNRSIRDANLRRTTPEEEIAEVLDKTNPSPAYRLGRLFAVLEKIQEEASPGLNATIRDRYYGAASSTPVAVFTTLLRLKNHHLAKLPNRGRAVNLEKLTGEIIDGIDEFPRHLALPDQGRFAVGYYHQRQAFFAVPDSDTPNHTDGN
jgi:CRISPR-associated protein Csd1